MGDKRRLHADAARRGGRGDPVSLGGESLPFAITRSPRTPTSRPPTSTSSPTRRPREVLVDTDNLPAMKATRAPAGGVSAGGLQRRGRSSTRPTASSRTSTTRRRRSTTTSRAASRSCWREAGPGGSREPSRLHEVHGVALWRSRRGYRPRVCRAGTHGGARGGRAAARRAAARRVPVPAAGARGLRGVRAAPLVHARGCRCSPGTGDGRRVGRARQLQGGRHRPGAALGVRARARAADLLRRCCRS